MDKTSFFYILSLVGLYEASVCPPEEDISPCICSFTIVSDVFKLRIDCVNILSPEQLVAPMMAIQRSEKEVYHLIFRNSSLLYLPADIFKNAHIKEAQFHDSELMSFSETDIAFSGLEEVLTSIAALNIKFASQWDFNQFRNLKALRQIWLNTVFLGSVDHSFPHLPELFELTFVNSEISYITDDAFSYIPKLQIFRLNDNKITEMKRSMLSNPANSLHYIDLSKNSLSYLPEDFFENMPKLFRVYLDHNKFTTLSEKLFSVVFRNVFLLLYMSDNPLHCDCRLHWLVNHKIPLFFRGQCSSPKTLSGRDIVTLDLKRLWC